MFFSYVCLRGPSIDNKKLAFDFSIHTFQPSCIPEGKKPYDPENKSVKEKGMISQHIEPQNVYVAWLRLI